MFKSLLVAAALVAGLLFTNGAQAQSSSGTTTNTVWCGAYACYYTVYTWNSSTQSWVATSSYVVYYDTDFEPVQP